MQYVEVHAHAQKGKRQQRKGNMQRKIWARVWFHSFLKAFSFRWISWICFTFQRLQFSKWWQLIYHGDRSFFFFNATAWQCKIKQNFRAAVHTHTWTHRYWRTMSPWNEFKQDGVTLLPCSKETCFRCHRQIETKPFKFTLSPLHFRGGQGMKDHMSVLHFKNVLSWNPSLVWTFQTFSKALKLASHRDNRL